MTIPRKRMPDRQRQGPVAYGEFEIRPAVLPAEEAPHRWDARVEIARRQDRTAVRHYDAERSFPTRREAEDHAVEFGKKIIAGNFPDHSPP